MSKTIEGVPEFISREQLVGLYKSVGVDPSKVTDMILRPDGISITLLAIGPDGKYVIDKRKRDAVFHEIYIPVKDEPHDA